jgi:DNA modification methylase
MSARVIVGDCIEAMRAMPENSITAIVTDPPYGLSPDGKARTWDDIEDGRSRGGFMGKAWDAAVPGVAWADECLRVLKPGGHLVAFGGTRTVHRLTCAIEDAGFEIRDMGVWVYWQGFPKSLDVSKAIDRHLGKSGEREVLGPNPSAVGRKSNKTGGRLIGGHTQDRASVDVLTAPATPAARTWQGYGTALKPTHEPWVLARKPLSGTVAANVLEWGTGALNIDGCRYGYGDPAWPGPQDKPTGYPNGPGGKSHHYSSDKRSAEVRPDPWEATALGRWPANLAAYPKASRGEREQGCEGLAAMTSFEATGREPGSSGMNSPRAGIRAGAVGRRTAEEATPIRNHHPTVKPLALMRWLVRLVGGQPNSPNTILDPFAGSGTTLAAATLEGFNSIGIELEPDYARIAKARIGWAKAERLHETRQADLFSPQPWQL